MTITLTEGENTIVLAALRSYHRALKHTGQHGLMTSHTMQAINTQQTKATKALYERLSSLPPEQCTLQAATLAAQKL